MLGLFSFASIFGPQHHVFSWFNVHCMERHVVVLIEVACSLLDGHIAKCFSVSLLAFLLQDHEEDQPVLESHVPSTGAV